jgi:hypothetical protein
MQLTEQQAKKKFIHSFIKTLLSFKKIIYNSTLVQWYNAWLSTGTVKTVLPTQI